MSSIRNVYHCSTTQRHMSSFQSQKPSINNRILRQLVQRTGNEHIYFLTLFPLLRPSKSVHMLLAQLKGVGVGGVSLKASVNQIQSRKTSTQETGLVRLRSGAWETHDNHRLHSHLVHCPGKPTAILNWPTCYSFSSEIWIPAGGGVGVGKIRFATLGHFTIKFCRFLIPNAATNSKIT